MRVETRKSATAPAQVEQLAEAVIQRLHLYRGRAGNLLRARRIRVACTRGLLWFYHELVGLLGGQFGEGDARRSEAVEVALAFRRTVRRFENGAHDVPKEVRIQFDLGRGRDGRGSSHGLSRVDGVRHPRRRNWQLRARSKVLMTFLGPI